MEENISAIPRLILCGCILLFVLAIAGESPRTVAQEKGRDDTSRVARGDYIVNGIAHCGDCHTPRMANGEPDTDHWLAGASEPYLPARPEQDWPVLAPRLAGSPPATDAQMITLLTTGIWSNGRPLRSPMPRFHMTTADAEAVLAYLKSVK
jgi:mono/diheme cytochrome c family protein